MNSITHKIYFAILIIAIYSCAPKLTPSVYQQSQEKNIQVSDSIYISGTLEYKNTDKLIIMIAGSGPTDRNGNAPGLQTNAFQMLADHFYASGISSFRYDKRGIANSTKVPESTMTIHNFTDDLNRIIDHFAKDFEEIILFGHSEGVLIGSMTAHTRSDIHSFIAIGGMSKTFDELLVDQFSKNYPFLAPQVKKHIEEIKNSKPLSEVHPYLKSVFRPSVVPLLSSSFKLNPKQEFAKLTLDNILIIHGECDIQMSISHAKQLKAVCAQAQLAIIPNMGHAMKNLHENCSNAYEAYSNSSLDLHPELLRTLNSFLLD